MKRWIHHYVVAAAVFGGIGSVNAQVVEKVADLDFVAHVDGYGVGGYAPLDRFTLYGTSLWYTTSRGGSNDAGTVSRLDLTTTTIVQVASFDNITGKESESPILFIGDEGYFTTVSGGAGNKGTIAKINTTNGVITTLHDFVTNGIPTGATPRGGLTKIGDDLWGMTSLGGVSNRGVLYKYNLTSGITTAVTNFTGAANGGQPFDGLMQLGEACYFTTFTGGSTFGAPGLTLGAGILGRLTVDAGGTAVVTRVVDLQAGFSQFPGSTPLAVGTNTIYFTTVGPNSSPGAIVRYDLDTGYWTNVCNFITNSPNPTLYGRQPGYNGLTEWQGKLYFMTRQGGSNNLGVISVYDPASNTVTKLADLTGTNGLMLGSASGSLNTGTIAEWDDRFYIYYPVITGGQNNRGTILRVKLPSPPIGVETAVNLQNGQLAMDWDGGYAPFTIQRSDSLSVQNWTNVLENLTNRVAELPLSGDAGTYRVVGRP